MTRIRTVLTGLVILILLNCPLDLISQAEGPDTAIGVVARILSEGNASGGIELNAGCEDMKKAQYTIKGVTIEEKLTSLQIPIPSLRWKKNAAGYRVLIGNYSPGSLMKVALPPIAISFGDLRDATDQLLNRPEVEANISGTHLKLFAQPIGYSSVAPASRKARTTLQLHSGTIADDLDKIAGTVGQTIWLYSTYSCNGTFNGRLIWMQ